VRFVPGRREASVSGPVVAGAQPPTLVRPSFEAIALGLAWAIAERSTCARLRVGCVITTADFRQVGWGYNGNVAGGPNACDRFGERAVGGCGCIHAELNALMKCDWPPGTPKVLINTDSPCEMCAKCILQKGGFQRVLYAREYRNPAGIDLLRRHGVAVERFNAPSWGPTLVPTESE